MTIPKVVAAQYERSERDDGNAVFTSSTLRLAVCEACGHVCKRIKEEWFKDVKSTTITVVFATETEPCRDCHDVLNPDSYGHHTPQSAQYAVARWSQDVLKFQQWLASARNDEVDARMTSLSKKIADFNKRIADVESRVMSATGRC